MDRTHGFEPCDRGSSPRGSTSLASSEATEHPSDIGRGMDRAEPSPGIGRCSSIWKSARLVSGRLVVQFHSAALETGLKREATPRERSQSCPALWECPSTKVGMPGLSSCPTSSTGERAVYTRKVRGSSPRLGTADRGGRCDPRCDAEGLSAILPRSSVEEHSSDKGAVAGSIPAEGTGGRADHITRGELPPSPSPHMYHRCTWLHGSPPRSR